jgi:2-keto-4-pentenoate hydratase/2-oxohepta-3-ene-1,7-dioic acid hydratase in catechol pathway
MTMERPGKIICVGRNYAAHAKELGNAIPERPLIFFKPTSALIGPGDAIMLPAVSQQVEYEAELVMVVGKRGRNILEAEAMEYVKGFTCANDVTCRDLQKIDNQWARAKGFDTFCPVFPEVVAVHDWKSLEVIARVNGKVRQHGHARDMIFSFPHLIAYISSIMTLEPGDLILTGTPDGVGPLHAGDVVEVEVPGIGVLRNPVRAETN